jgi:hypothetical protein
MLLGVHDRISMCVLSRSIMSALSQKHDKSKGFVARRVVYSYGLTKTNTIRCGYFMKAFFRVSRSNYCARNSALVKRQSTSTSSFRNDPIKNLRLTPDPESSIWHHDTYFRPGNHPAFTSTPSQFSLHFLLT